MPTQLLLFGPPGLGQGPDDPEILTLQPKRAAVLAYLVVARPGPFHRRDSLLAMFWPEHDSDRGRNALSKAIHHLRGRLPPGAILTQGDQVGVAPELWCDVTEFERALESGRTEDAFALYRGDLLQGFHIPGSPDFDHWSGGERNRLRRMAVASAWELASGAEQAGDAARATEFARQAVEWAPRDESGVRRFLTLLHSRGNRAEALEVFETFARELRRDFEVDPSTPTLELVQAIRDGSLPDGLVTPPTADSEQGAPSSATRTVEHPAAEQGLEPHPPARSPFHGSAQPPKHSRGRRHVVAAIAVGLAGLAAFPLLRHAWVGAGEEGRSAGRVLVTEFEDGTEEGLGAVVSEALRIDLVQSSALDLVDRADVVGTLGLMGLASDVPISAEVGREVAVRDGLETLVEGAVVRAGTGYILTATIRAGGDGRAIESFRQSVATPDQMIASIDGLSLGIRQALGEKLETIGAGPPLDRVTTSSLEALTLYTRAISVFELFDDRPQAASLLQRAVAIDPGFAMAWRMLAISVQGDADQSLRIEATRQAYLERDRLSELERYFVEANYYEVVEVDRARAAQALLRVLDLDPENVRALNNLGIHYLYMSEPERAEEVFSRLVETPGVSSTAHRNLVDTRLSLGRIEEASHALADFEREYPDHELLPGLRVRIHFLSGDLDEARAGSQLVIDDPLLPAARRANAWAFLASVAYWEGRCEDGRDNLLEAERVDVRADDAAAMARVVGTAHTVALVDDVEWAADHVGRRLEAGLPESVVLNQGTAIQLIELSALTAEVVHDDVMKDAVARGPHVANMHARITAGDTVGLRTAISQLPLHIFRRVLLSERLGDLEETIALYEEVVRPGYTGWGNSPFRLRALMRLGPLYEQAGDTAKAIEAYGSFAQRWSSGDERCRSLAARFSDRARALESEIELGGTEPR